MTPRSSCSFSGMSESSSSNGTRPTCATQIRARSEPDSGIASSTSAGVPVGVGEQPQRQPLRIQRRVVLVLPAVGGQRLPEITGAVVQADRDQRQPEIRRRLRGGRRPGCPDRRSSSAAPRQRRTPSRSRRCRSGIGVAVLCLLLVPQRTAQIVVEFGGQLVEPVQERAVDRQLVEPGRTDRAQQGHRIAPALRPTASGRSSRTDPGSACPTTSAG